MQKRVIVGVLQNQLSCSLPTLSGTSYTLALFDSLATARDRHAHNPATTTQKPPSSLLPLPSSTRSGGSGPYSASPSWWPASVGEIHCYLHGHVSFSLRALWLKRSPSEVQRRQRKQDLPRTACLIRRAGFRGALSLSGCCSAILEVDASAEGCIVMLFWSVDE